MLVDAGFADVRVDEKAESKEFIKDWLPGSGAEDYVVSANVTAYKPAVTTAGAATTPVADVDDDVASSTVTALFSRAAGVSVAAAGPVGRAVIELLNAVGGVVKAAAEHHGRHTDASTSNEGGCCGGGGAAEEKVVEEVVEVEEDDGCCSKTGG